MNAEVGLPMIVSGLTAALGRQIVGAGLTASLEIKSVMIFFGE